MKTITRNEWTTIYLEDSMNTWYNKSRKLEIQLEVPHLDFPVILSRIVYKPDDLTIQNKAKFTVHVSSNTKIITDYFQLNFPKFEDNPNLFTASNLKNLPFRVCYYENYSDCKDGIKLQKTMFKHDPRTRPSKRCTII